MRNLIHLLLIAVSMFAGSVFAAETGYVHAMSGDVTITQAGKASAKAKVGDLFEQGTSFTTGADGKAVIKFADGQVIALAPNTNFVVSSYDYNAANVPSSNIVFSLVRGGMRFVTGLIGQTSPSKFAVRTPTLTAGVRGTDGTIAIGPKGETLVTVKQGVVTITSAAGTVVINEGSFAFYPPGATTPSATGPLSAMPAEAQALILMVNELGSRDLPSPTPVDVIQAAKEAVDAQSAAGAPGSPAPTPGPGGGGGGGTGTSPS